MPTSYIKKLAKLNHTTVNKIEKFWAQAKEIAKSEGQGNSWGLITSIFQNKLKKEGYKVKAFYEPDTLDSTTENKLDYVGQVKKCIKQIWARGINQEQIAKEWSNNYGNLISDCFYKNIEPKVCARMCYIKYHKENPYTKHLNKNLDTDFSTLMKEAKQYFDTCNKDLSTKVKAFKEETRTSESGQTFKFQRLSLSSIQKLLGYYLEDNEWDSSTHWNDLYDDNDGIVYIEYNDNKTFYSVTNPLLKDLKTTNIRNCIIEYPSYTAYFGKDCRIEKFDSKDDSPWVVKSSKEESMKPYLYHGETIIASSKKEAIKKIIGYTFGNRTTKDVKDYLKTYSPIEEEALHSIELYIKEIKRLLKADGQVRILADKHTLNGLCHLCHEARVSCYDAFRYISNNS